MQRTQHTMGKNLHHRTSSGASRKYVTSRDVKIINILFLIIRKKLWKLKYIKKIAPVGNKSLVED